MPSPFPGMDPFLEDAEVWPGFHADLAIELKRRLNQRLTDAYYADVELYSSAEDMEVEISYRIQPDINVTASVDTLLEPQYGAAVMVAIPAAPLRRVVPFPSRLRSVRIYHTATRELVTAIEILSPTNKRPASDGLRDYRRKRQLILRSNVHLVEIDLLRGGERPGLELVDDPLDTDYILIVNRDGVERLSEIWPVALNTVLPVIPIPLRSPDPDLPLDLSAAIQEVYSISRYDRRIRYHRPLPLPPVRPALAEWVAGVLAAQAHS